MVRVMDWKAVHEKLVEDMISGALPGERPGDERHDEARQHVLRLEISGAALTWREAQARLTRETGGSLSDEDLVQLMARRVLDGAAEGKASYQIAVTVCERCQRGWQSGGGQKAAMTESQVAKARCDAQEIGDVKASASRATQDVTPATRRQVQHRDGGRCVVDGCTQAVWLDIHHIEWREEGGGHHPDNLSTLCAAHHTAVHEGRLVVEGKPSTGLTFRHADGTIYGKKPNLPASAASADAFLALKTLGYKEKEARFAITKALAHVGQAGLEELIRRGLQELRTDRCSTRS
jgi:hypothetical protein